MQKLQHYCDNCGKELTGSYLNNIDFIFSMSAEAGTKNLNDVAFTAMDYCNTYCLDNHASKLLSEVVMKLFYKRKK